MMCRRLTIRHGGELLVDIDFEITHSLALVGQSGSGKSLTLKALLGLLPKQMELTMDIEGDFELIAGETIAFVPQNAFTALSPMSKIKKQLLHDGQYLRELFEILGLEEGIFERFPSQLSGGQLQRVVIAIALSSHPRLLLLDEPTTALDPEVREDIVKILLQLQTRFGFLILFVTHDIKIALSLCRDMVVLNEGRVVERGTSSELLTNPKEQYTRRLIESNFSNREFRA